MFDKTFAVYLGKNSAELAAGFVVENGLFCALEIKGVESENRIRLVTEKIREALQNTTINSLPDLQSFAQKLIKKHDLFSLSCGYLYQFSIFVFSQNALVLLSQKGEIYRIAAGQQCLKGNFAPGDSFIFLTDALAQIKVTEQIKEIVVQEQRPKLVVEQLKKAIKLSQSGALLIVQTDQVESLPTHKQEAAPPLSSSSRFRLKPKIPLPPLKYIVGAVITLILLVVLFNTLSKVVQRRKVQAFQEKFTQLEQQYKQTKKHALTNPSSAAKQINELKKEINSLIDQYPQNKKQINPLAKQISGLQKTFGSAEINQAKLYFDLDLIDKKAKADYFDMTETSIALIDASRQKAYLIDLESKKQTTYSLKDLKQPKLITEAEGSLYVLDQNKGLWQLQEEKPKQLLKKDKEWKEIIDLKIFNQNLYLLDRSQDEIYKYTPIVDGYGSKTSYFQPDYSIDLNTAKNMAIDFSVYVLTDLRLWKYTGGSQTDFGLKQDLDLSKARRVYKNPSTNFLYLLDSSSARIIVLNEGGRLIKSVFNPKLKQAIYFGVSKDEKIIFLIGNKLYQLDKF